MKIRYPMTLRLIGLCPRCTRLFRTHASFFCKVVGLFYTALLGGPMMRRCPKMSSAGLDAAQSVYVCILGGCVLFVV